MNKELSSLQQSIILNQQLQPDNASYNLPYLWKLTGQVKVNKLYASLMNTFNNHAVYHSFLKDGELVYDSNTKFRPKIIEMTYPTDEEFEIAVMEQAKIYANTPFNNSVWPLQQAIIFINTRDFSEEYFLFINVSHLICDIYSAYEIINEISDRYNNKVTTLLEEKKPLSVNKISEKREQRAKDYFSSRLPLISSLEQPSLTIEHTSNRRNIDITVSRNVVTKLMNLSKKTEFEVLLTAYTILLSSITSQQIVTIGIPLANRHPEERHTHGCFVNNLPLIINVGESEQLHDLLQDVSFNLHNLLRFQSFDLQSHLKELVDSRENYKFMNNSVTLYKYEVNFDFDHIACENIIVEQTSPMFPLAMEFENSNDKVIVHIQTSGQYSPYFIGRYFKDILLSMDSLTKSIQDDFAMGKELKNELIALENDKIEAILPEDINRSVLELFHDECTLHPDSLAVRYKETELTYKELDVLSTKIANKLRTIDLEKIVVSMESDSRLIAIILGVFKSGKIYVPLDKNMPEQRKTVILEQLDNFLVLTDYNSPIFNRQANLNIDDLLEDIEHYTNITEASIKNNEVAYIIFTSGSTGVPKGVEVKHSSLFTLMSDCKKKLKNPFGKNWILFHSYGFDYSIFEIMAPVTSGGTLNIVPTNIRKFPDRFRNFLIENDINILTQTPSAFLSLQKVDTSLDNFIESLEYIFIGGEDVKFADLSLWFDKYGYKHPKVFNLYGLTETTIISTAHQISQYDVDNKKRNNIGKSIDNTLVYVKNKNNKMVLPGFEGELIISGPAVSKGYYKNEVKTKEVFDKKTNSFKTGDLVKVLLNGELQYISRIDKQVQVSGHRIELGEIESAINSCQSCEESYVMAQDFAAGDRRLVGYYRLSSYGKIEADLIRKEIKKKLPDYMIPSFFIEVEEFPLNTSGKIDSSKLPPVNVKKTPEQQKSVPLVVDEETTVLASVKNIWSDVLGTKINGDDNFFEVGGTSVLITEIYYRMLKEFELSENDMTMIDLFDYVTPSEVSKFIENILKEK
ncbi:non-ribosomal peptide synthetase [Streptococcus mutans]|uniref:Putative bacitracin synthetase 1 n=1 Tax=Streptococcus mutans SM6 TaxID=857119 RepID=A0A829BW06_STRMG|nr:amino acid adenylation domain-containing protein [Streptococcus mutans]EMC24320.1 putative bacitracin synthetase 1 [Streptococcus mutans SM6]